MEEDSDPAADSSAFKAVSASRFETLEELCAAARRGVMARLGFRAGDGADTTDNTCTLGLPSHRDHEPALERLNYGAQSAWDTRMRPGVRTTTKARDLFPWRGAGRAQHKISAELVTADIGFFAPPQRNPLESPGPLDIAESASCPQDELFARSRAVAQIGPAHPFSPLQVPDPAQELVWIPSAYSYLSLPCGADSVIQQNGAGGTVGGAHSLVPTRGPFDGDFLERPQIT